MNKLIYGFGSCSIETDIPIAGIQLGYSGKFNLEDKTPEGFAIGRSNNIILIFPLPVNKDRIGLIDLFAYDQEFRISNCIASDWDGKPVKLKIEFQAHFPDKIKSNPEDMTLKPEDMVRYNYGKNISITPHNNILENFSTDDNVKLYLEDGTEYFGAFHFHMTNDSGIMTGEAHTKDSKELFTKLKNTNELKSTKLKNKNLLKQRTYNG